MAKYVIRFMPEYSSTSLWPDNDKARAGVRKTGSQSAKGKIVLFSLSKKYEKRVRKVRKEKSYFSRGQKSTIAV